MATTADLSKLIDREMGKGQGPFLVRICQDAGLLPKAKRGGWRSMEQLTDDHLADFIIAVVGTRAVGQRNANGARAAVERFSPLTCDWLDGSGVRTLREDIANFLFQYRISLEIGMGYSLHWILFINDEHRPEVEIRLNPRDGDKPSNVHNYVDPEVEAEEGLVREAAVIGPILFSVLADLGRENVTQDAS